MTQTPGQAPLGYLNPNFTKEAIVVRQTRAPTANDIPRDPNTFWHDDTNGNLYFFNAAPAGVAEWIVVGTDFDIPLDVSDGGTGLTTFTANAIVIGDGTNPLDTVGPLTDGQLLIGDTGGDPVAAALTAGTAISATTGAGSLQLDVDVSTDAEAQAESIDTDVLTPGNLAAVRDATNITYTQSPILQSNANTGAAPSGGTGDINLMYMQEGEIGRAHV